MIDEDRGTARGAEAARCLPGNSTRWLRTMRGISNRTCAPCTSDARPSSGRRSPLSSRSVAPTFLNAVSYPDPGKAETDSARSGRRSL